jgi:hypothetical protein
MLIGYARVSTLEQNLDLQEDALRVAGCQKVYTDKTSGTKAEVFPSREVAADGMPPTHVAPPVPLRIVLVEQTHGEPLRC